MSLLMAKIATKRTSRNLLARQGYPTNPNHTDSSDFHCHDLRPMVSIAKSCGQETFRVGPDYTVNEYI